MDDKNVAVTAASVFVAGYLVGALRTQYRVYWRMKKATPLIQNALEDLLRKQMSGELTEDELVELALQEVDFIKIAMNS